MLQSPLHTRSHMTELFVYGDVNARGVTINKKFRMPLERVQEGLMMMHADEDGEAFDDWAEDVPFDQCWLITDLAQDPECGSLVEKLEQGERVAVMGEEGCLGVGRTKDDAMCAYAMSVSQDKGSDW